MTKAEEAEELKSLRRKCLFLWKAVVKKNAGGKCEAPEECKTVKFLNAHHIEGYMTNKGLRYNPRNGVLLCSSHHKFKSFSAHKSFIFMYKLMTGKRRSDLIYLLSQRDEKILLTKETEVI